MTHERSVDSAWATKLIDDTVHELFEMLGEGEAGIYSLDPGTDMDPPFDVVTQSCRSQWNGSDLCAAHGSALLL